MQNDNNTNIEHLKGLLREFRDKRNWAQFHDLKNLAEAISIEAGELQEHFLWKDKKEVDELFKTEKFKIDIAEELADIICFSLNFANTAGIDVTEAVVSKIEKNDKKYPVEKVMGKSDKYTEYEP